MLASSVSLVDAAPKRVYKGKTKQRHKMKVSVRGNKLKVLHFKANLKCKDGSTLIVDERGFKPTKIRGNGRFKDVQVGTTDEVFIKGKRKGKVVRGKVRVKDRLRKGGVRCHSHWVKFTARSGKR
jgi:hypothetical protein